LKYSFKNKNQRILFTKFIILTSGYFCEAEWDKEIMKIKRAIAEKMVRDLGIPDGWQSIGNYEKLKEWFLKHYFSL
jgi:hypothetical protein